jgi:prepilin-type processing-associated H-X9-DG protein
MLRGRAAGHTLRIDPDVYRGRVRNMLFADGRPEALALVEEFD